MCRDKGCFRGSTAPLLVAALCLLTALMVLSGCADWKWVRRPHLDTVADGIEWYVERTQAIEIPGPELDAEVSAAGGWAKWAEKVERVGGKVLRNARALAK